MSYHDQHSKRVERKRGEDVTQIEPGLFLGNYRARGYVKEYGFKRVITIVAPDEYARPERWHTFTPSDGVRVENVFYLEDVEESDIEPVLRLTTPLLRHSVERVKEPVLVHCMAGISRSVTVLAAYLMQRDGLDNYEVLAKIKRLRPIIDPNQTFREILEGW